MPQQLYKYRSLGERTEEILSAKKIWLAKPSTLNDPFECRIKPIDPEDLRLRSIEAQKHQLDGFVWCAHSAHENKEHFFGLQGREINRLLSKIKKAAGFSKKYRIANEFLLGVGAVGFSRTDSYADSISDQMSNVGVFSREWGQILNCVCR